MSATEETLQLANDPNTSTEVLTQLYAHADAALNKALSQNPNTPKEILISLAAKHALELVNNPSFELFFIEDPAFFKMLPYEAQQAMIDQISSMPNWLIEIMIQGYASRLARQPSTPVWALNYLSRAKPPEIRSALASNSNLPEDLFWYLSEDPERSVRNTIARNPSIPQKLLWHLSEDPEQMVRRMIAQNPSAPEEPLWFLAEHENTEVRLVLCGNTALPEELFWFFAKSPQAKLRSKLALNPKAPEGVLEYLSLDEDLEVTSNVARNQTTSLALLLRLATHPSLQVRLNVFRNKQIRNNLQELISQQPTPGQLSLFSLPTPTNQLIALLTEPSAQQALYWEALLYDGAYSAVSVAKWAKSSQALIRRVVAGAARDEKELLSLCDDPELEVREALLLNRYSPAEALSRLLQTKTLSERLSLAAHPTLSENLLLKLSQDEQEEVRAAIAARGFLPQAVVEVLCKDSSLAVQQSAALHSHRQPPGPEEVHPEEESHFNEDPISFGWGEPEDFVPPPEPDEAQWEDLEEDLGALIEEICHSEIDLDSFDHDFEDEE